MHSKIQPVIYYIALRPVAGMEREHFMKRYRRLLEQIFIEERFGYPRADMLLLSGWNLMIFADNNHTQFIAAALVRMRVRVMHFSYVGASHNAGCLLTQMAIAALRCKVQRRKGLSANDPTVSMATAPVKGSIQRAGRHRYYKAGYPCM